MIIVMHSKGSAMFNILEHLDKLEKVKRHSTWIEAACPACGGKLKISSSSARMGSYACYTEECHTQMDRRGRNKIRAILQPDSPFRTSNVFATSNIFKAQTRLSPTALPISTSLDLSSPVIYVRPNVTQVDMYKRVVKFDYSGFSSYRVDYVDRETGVLDKYFYPMYMSDKGNVLGLPSGVDLPVYREDYISKDLVIAEGEKCATYLQRLGISCISIYGPYSGSSLLAGIMLKLRDRGVSNVVYLEDNDKPGRSKARKVLEECWRSGIHASSINVTDLYPQYRDIQGFDIADLYAADEIASYEDVVGLIQRGLSYGR